MSPIKRQGSIIKDLADITGLSFKRRYSEVLEAQLLEKEIQKDDFPPPKRKIDRFRRKGELICHSKPILMTIVLLNLVDCVLVMGELVLDIHYIKGILDTSDIMSQTFIDKMERRYPDNLYNNDIDHMQAVFDKMYEATCHWNDQRDSLPPYNSTESTFDDTRKTTLNGIRTRREEITSEEDRREDILVSSPTKHKDAHAHSIWEDISHGLHKASIAILAVLFIENSFKLMFMGRRFIENKLETFDAVIVFVSFVVDLVFLKGLTEYRIQDGILILSFLLPWRVIRVVNSLIVAVLDHEHFRLKMMYKQQKTVSAESKVLKENMSKFQFHLKQIERFCLSEGIPHWKIVQHLAFDEKQLTVSSMASYVLGGVLTGLGDSDCNSCLVSKHMRMSAGDISNYSITHEIKGQHFGDNIMESNLTKAGNDMDISKNNNYEKIAMVGVEENENVYTTDKTRSFRENNIPEPNDVLGIDDDSLTKIEIIVPYESRNER